jgi:hypothetical protein
LYVNPLPIARERHVNYTNIDFRFSKHIPGAPIHKIFEELKILLEEQENKQLGLRQPILVLNCFGVGKTVTLLEAATHYYSIWIDCITEGGANVDTNYSAMVKDIEEMFGNKSTREIHADQMNFRRMASNRVELEICARLVYLCNFLHFAPEKFRNAKSFLDSQISGGQQIIRTIVK